MTGQYAGETVVAFMAGIFEDRIFTAAVVDNSSPRGGPGAGILDGEFILQIVGGLGCAFGKYGYA